MTVLVINAGSSSVKFGLFGFNTLEPLARGMIDWAGHERQATITVKIGATEARKEIDVPDYREGVALALDFLRETVSAATGNQPTIRAVGHRLIHGGEEIRCPVCIDEETKKTIARYVHLAPLHIPAGLQAIEATEAALPGVPQAGLFDTAFFADIPPAVYLYPVPYSWYEDWGIRRFGFHGTSHAYCTQRATAMLDDRQSPLRLVICHLGQGSSATAVRDGVALKNTMGFTPLEGLMMGTRSGTIDPGILLHVQRTHGMSVEELEDTLQKQSGLLGLSGVSSDFRKVQAAADSGNSQAKLALDVYAHRIRESIGSLTVTAGGIDALIFTGGIGENQAGLREEVCRGLDCLGLHLDTDRNKQCQPDIDIATDDSPARILVIHTREDYLIARETRRLVRKER
jgi:acetate kinase